MNAKAAKDENRTVAENRKARHNYFIEETLEAGIVLAGTEVKALRGGQANIADAYAGPKGDELWLVNCYIPEYVQANRQNHETRRPRKLLLHRREIARLEAEVARGGMTIVPLAIYFNARGIAKVRLGVAKGKQLHDKRQTERARDWAREKSRLLRSRG